ncbi:transmembrane protein 80 [Strigops habroptila]|nr:transmembrane protein 80 [Strigops habroptila]
MVPEVSRVFRGLVRGLAMVPDERGPRFLPAGQSQSRRQPSPAESVGARPEAIPDRSGGEPERARTGPSPRAVRPRGSKNPELVPVFSDLARRRVRRTRGKPSCAESSPIAPEFPFAGPNGDARTGSARIRPNATEPGRALRSHPKAGGAGVGQPAPPKRTDERSRRGACRDAGGLGGGAARQNGRCEARSASVMSSVPLQLLFYVNGIYFIFYFLATLAMVLYKSQVFSYPDDFLTLDLTLLFIMAIVEVLRLYLGSRGNLTEEEGPLGLSLVMTVGSVFLAVYFLVWQTYILKADVILNAVLLLSYGMESILKVSAIAAFIR